MFNTFFKVLTYVVVDVVELPHLVHELVHAHDVGALKGDRERVSATVSHSQSRKQVCCAHLAD